jgi:hypothetical protein
VSREKDEKNVREHWAWEHRGKSKIFFASRTRGYDLFLMFSQVLPCVLHLDVPLSSFCGLQSIFLGTAMI